MVSILLFIPTTVFADTAQVSKPVSLREACLKSTIKAIEIEIDIYRERLNKAKQSFGPKGNIEKFTKILSRLKVEYEKFNNMKTEDYSLVGYSVTDNISSYKKFGPEMPPIKDYVTISEFMGKKQYKFGSLLDLVGMSKSGPFYRIVGVHNDDYNKLNKSSELTIYLVYKKQYFGFIQNYYVYIADMKN